MFSRWIIGFLLLMCLTVTTVAQTSKVASKITLPAYKRVKLSNGLTLLLMEQHEVPIISFNLRINAGSVADPVGKEGVAYLTAEMLRKGTPTRTAQQIADQVDFVGGSLGFGAGLDASVGSAEFLKKDLNYGLDILADVLQNSNFPQQEFDKLKSQSVDAITDLKDNPGAVIRFYYNRYLFGNHPYGRPLAGDEKSLPGIALADVKQFYQQYYGPANLIIAVAGDFQTAEMEQLLTNKLGTWQKATTTSSKVVAPQYIKETKLLFVDKPDATQTYFMIGNVGIARNSPDRVGVAIINTLFGVRFTSLLNSELRIKTGLTYGARSFFSRNLQPGPFAITTYTRNATTQEAMDLALTILRRLHENGITAEQLESTKTYIKGQFGPELETTNSLAATLIDLEANSLTPAEIDDYFTQIDNFSLADAQRVIKQYFPRENLVFTIVGKGEEVQKLMPKYSPKVETRKISEPGF